MIKNQIYKNWKSLWGNFIIYTNDNFQRKWSIYNRKKISEKDIKVFLIDLTYEINLINKNLLKSLFIFSQKKNILFLSNIIYEINKDEFINPLLNNQRITKSAPILINNSQKTKKSNFTISSCFTPPNSFMDQNIWTRKQFNNLDDIISF
jgi:hypothetical protein